MTAFNLTIYYFIVFVVFIDNGRKTKATGFRSSNNPVEPDESQREKENEDVKADLILICII